MYGFVITITSDPIADPLDLMSEVILCNGGTGECGITVCQVGLR
jgi:hypothetical protein